MPSKRKRNDREQKEETSSSSSEESSTEESSKEDGDDVGDEQKEKDNDNDKKKHERIQKYIFATTTYRRKPKYWRYNNSDEYQNAYNTWLAEKKRDRTELKMAKRDLDIFVSTQQHGNEKMMPRKKLVAPADDYQQFSNSKIAKFMYKKPGWRFILKECCHALAYVTEKYPRDEKLGFTQQQTNSLYLALKHKSEEIMRQKNTRKRQRLETRNKKSNDVIRMIHPIHELLFTHQLTLDSWLKKQSFFFPCSSASSSSSASAASLMGEVAYSRLTAKEQQTIKYQITEKLLDPYPYAKIFNFSEMHGSRTMLMKNKNAKMI